MLKEATLGAGCFWCIEACYKDLKGVVSVFPGYSGGQKLNPTYDDICDGNTGHAEVARIIFNDEIVTFEQILEVFWFVHDPTQLNRQGGDIGTQYRSVIFYHDEYQREISEKMKLKLEYEKVWENTIVTEISPLINYYQAESYHFDYYNLNKDKSYCSAVIRPKIEKFRKVFSNHLK